jgi:hypothetical protein
MPHSLSESEPQRPSIVQQMAELGDLRPGSITRTSGRCGKSNGRCHRQGEPAHGPNFRLTIRSRAKRSRRPCPRRQAMVGPEAPFEHGREPMNVLAGLEVTAKPVERTAEAKGADVVRRERGRADPGSGCGNGRDRRAGKARSTASLPKPVKSNGGASLLRRRGIKKVIRSVIRIPPPTLKSSISTTLASIFGT